MEEGYSAEEEALVSLVLKWIDRPSSIVTDQLYATFRHLFNACSVNSLSDDVEIRLQALAEKIKKTRSNSEEQEFTLAHSPRKAKEGLRRIREAKTT